jgi:hypothetical protein
LSVTRFTGSRSNGILGEDKFAHKNPALAWSKTEEAESNFLSNRKQADEYIQEGVNGNDKGHSRRRFTQIHKS